MMVAPTGKKLADIPGLCGIVRRQHPAGLFRAGSRPVGRGRHLQLVCQLHPAAAARRPARTRRSRAAAAKLKPGESGLLALDWNNGNRTILVDQRLTGLLLGQTLYTTPAEIYRALIEATAFGALTIINRFEEYGVKVEPDRQLRRHRREEPAGDADLRGRDGPADEDFALGADLRARRGHRRGGRGRRVRGLRRGAEGDDRPEIPRVSSRTRRRTRFTGNCIRSTGNCTMPSARRNGPAICTT